MSEIIVVESEEIIYVDAATSRVSALYNGPKGERGPQGIAGPAGSLSGYLSTTDLTNTVNVKDVPVDTLEAQRGSWTTLSLINGWINPNSAQNLPARYRKIDGIVYFEGVIGQPASSFTNQFAALPAGFRPSGTVLIGTLSGDPIGIGRFDISPTGAMTYIGGEFDMISLCGVKFGVGPVGMAIGAIGWAGSSAGVRTPAVGGIGWIGSATGTKAPIGSASRTITWAGSATGIRP